MSVARIPLHERMGALSLAVHGSRSSSAASPSSGSRSSASLSSSAAAAAAPASSASSLLAGPAASSGTTSSWAGKTNMTLRYKEQAEAALVEAFSAALRLAAGDGETGDEGAAAGSASGRRRGVRLACTDETEAHNLLQLIEAGLERGVTEVTTAVIPARNGSLTEAQCLLTASAHGIALLNVTNKVTRMRVASLGNVPALQVLLGTWLRQHADRLPAGVKVLARLAMPPQSVVVAPRQPSTATLVGFQFMAQWPRS